MIGFPNDLGMIRVGGDERKHPASVAGKALAMYWIAWRRTILIGATPTEIQDVLGAFCCYQDPKHRDN